MVAEIEFYRRPHGGGLSPGQTVDLSNAEAALAPGARYGLVGERLARGVTPEGTLVELGCGDGEILLLLSRRHEFGRIVGIDVAINEPVTANGVEFRNDNLNDRWPFEDGTVDHLVAMMVFEHLFDPFHCFEEVRRTLSSDGTAYVNVPLVTNLKNRFRLMLGLLPETSVDYGRWFRDRVWDGNHIHYFSIDSLHRLAASCKLRIVAVRGVGRGHVLKTQLPSLFAGEITIALKSL
jgi:cyclopropane fatty-acyl-phospholipid synthase-like methyltransferase